jgi:uncharacterized protein (TIGR00725 family)
MGVAPHTITVFGSSRPREGSVEYDHARTLGRALTTAGFIVCSGGYSGTMEGVSRGAKEAGGRTIAVTAEFFAARANRWVDEEVRVNTWQERLFALIERGAGYVACKGGTGTLVELAVVWEMLNKRVMPEKPFVVLGDFWGPILERVREVETGHASPWGEADNRLVHLAPDPIDAANYLAARLALTSPSSHR